APRATAPAARRRARPSVPPPRTARNSRGPRRAAVVRSPRPNGPASGWEAQRPNSQAALLGNRTGTEQLIDLGGAGARRTGATLRHLPDNASPQTVARAANSSSPLNQLRS